MCTMLGELDNGYHSFTHIVVSLSTITIRYQRIEMSIIDKYHDMQRCISLHCSIKYIKGNNAEIITHNDFIFYFCKIMIKQRQMQISTVFKDKMYIDVLEVMFFVLSVWAINFLVYICVFAVNFLTIN